MCCVSAKIKSFLTSALGILATYALWLVASAGSLYALLLARGAINAFFRMITLNRWVVGAIDRFGLFFLGIIGLIVVLYMEHYLLEGKNKGLLLRRFGICAGIIALACAFFYLVERVSFALLVQ
jgi:hypothetical protein